MIAHPEFLAVKKLSKSSLVEKMVFKNATFGTEKPHF